MKFNSQIIAVDNSMTRSSFPEVFSNEVYFSKTEDFKPMAYTSTFSVKFAVAGESNYLVNGHKHLMKTGSILIINEGANVECSSTLPEEGLSIFLEKEVIEEVRHLLVNDHHSLLNHDNDLSSQPYFYDKVILPDMNCPLLAKLDQIINRYRQDTSLFLTNSFYYEMAELLLTTQADLRIKVESINKARLSTRKEIFKRVQTVKEYLDDSLNHRFDLDQLSKEVALSKYHLIRCYKEVYKTTPQKYFIHRKIELAKRLLKYHTVGDVAQLLSYRDIHSFSRQFKLTTGLAPSRYNKV